jgi:DNA-binding winged helix-turn-helix (wHTH) protein
MSRKTPEIHPKSAETVTFRGFVFLTNSKVLQTAEGKAVDLRSQSAEVLSLLAARSGEIVSKDALMQAVWADTFVTDDSLVQCIADIRHALGDDAHVIVETFPKRGYRLNVDRSDAAATARPLRSDVKTEAPSSPPPEVLSVSSAREQHPMLDMIGGKKVPVTGGCLCGEIRYRVTEPALDTNFCHCRMCQKFSGSPVTAASTYPSGAVQFTKGEPRYYKSSPFAERGFCANCGSSLTYRPLVPPLTPAWANWISIHTASLDNPAPNAPTWHLGVENQMPWVDIQHARKRVRCQDSPDLVEAWAAFNLPVP